MARYIIRRLLISAPVLLAITVITFFLLRASGDPMAVYASNPSVTAEDLIRLEKTYDFDRPL
ncbi:MAG: ABC transporter permease, partial [Anaerolineae bacterium]|nr:ABC transporter permease [Anaerolineae bacterium]